MIQEIHDLIVGLGAKCAEPESEEPGEGDGEGKGATKRRVKPSAGPSVLATRVAIELLEQGPMEE
jgi:hypothetical protein